MLVLIWVFLAALATIVSAVAIYTADDGIAILTGVIGFLTWGFCAFGALNLQRVMQSNVYTTSMPGVAMFCILLGLLPGYIALTGPFELIGRYRDGDSDDL